MIKEYNNYLPHWLHNKAKFQLEEPSLGWFFPNSNSKNLNESAFFRHVYHTDSGYENWNNIDALIYVLDYWLEDNKDLFELDEIHRCMLNLYSKGQCPGEHTDMDDSNYYSLLYYVSDSDGGTVIENNTFSHKENTLLFFNSNLLHCAIPTVNSARRITANWILKGNIKKPA